MQFEIQFEDFLNLIIGALVTGADLPKHSEWSALIIMNGRPLSETQRISRRRLRCWRAHRKIRALRDARILKFHVLFDDVRDDENKPRRLNMSEIVDQVPDAILSDLDNLPTYEEVMAPGPSVVYR